MSIHHRGVFITHSDTHVKYARGTESRVSDVDPDTFVVFVMPMYAKDLGIMNVAEFFYRIPHMELYNGLFPLKKDDDVRAATANLIESGKSDEEHNIKSDEEHNIKIGKSDYGHSNILCTPINSEDDEEHPKYIEFRDEVDMPNPVFEKGMLFSDHKEFKRAVQSYRIKHEYLLLIVKNESQKVSYKCENCEWYIYASWDREENSLLVKTYWEKHTCSRVFHSRMVSARWIAVAWLEVFKGKPNIKSAEIKEGIKNQFQVDISLDKAFRARQIALEMPKGSYCTAIIGL
nr:hypothetical protein CFP56_01717 [Quercus suber]